MAAAQPDIEMTRLLCLKAALTRWMRRRQNRRTGEFRLIKVARVNMALKIVDERHQAFTAAAVWLPISGTCARMYRLAAGRCSSSKTDGPDEVHNRTIRAHGIPPNTATSTRLCRANREAELLPCGSR